MTAFDSIFLLP